MSEQKWKVGDIALITGYDGPDRPAVFATSECEVRGHRWAASGHWHYLDDAEPTNWTSNPAVEARPLAVIDPEDRVQVERLGELFSSHRGHSVGELWRDAMQAALREFANPVVKPEEPTRFGAVVIDDNDEVWIRTSALDDDADDLNKPWYRRGVRRNWQIVDAVKVLSDGIPA